MRKKSKTFTGGRQAVGTPTLNKAAMFGLIRKVRKEREARNGKG